MTPTQTCIVGLRLLAVYFAVASAMQFFQGIITPSPSRHWQHLGYWGYYLLMMCVGAVLYRYALPIGKALLRATPSDVPVQPAAPEEWFLTGVSLLGLWFSTKSIPGIFDELCLLLVNQNNSSGGAVNAIIGDYHLHNYVIEQFFGILLLLGRKGIARMLARARGLERH
jgi:hypothetical protein